mgnify:CR=1 FL=1
MSVDTTTGEIIEFDPAAAERRAERIVLRLDAIVENYRMVLPMIREAIEKRDDIALGYRSPGDYVSDRFGQSLSGLGIEARRAVVHELTDAGLSTRAIAPVIGTSHMTVQNDIEKSGVKAFTPARPIAPAANSGSTITTTTGTVIAETKHIDIDRPRPPKPTTGIDGKTYTRRPMPPQVSRDEQDRLDALDRDRARVIGFLNGWPTAHRLLNGDKDRAEILNGLAGPYRDKFLQIESEHFA